MRTFIHTTDTDILPDIPELMETLRGRNDVAFVEYGDGGINAITNGGDTLRYVHYLENDSIVWVCYVQ